MGGQDTRLTMLLAACPTYSWVCRLRLGHPWVLAARSGLTPRGLPLFGDASLLVPSSAAGGNGNGAGVAAGLVGV